MSDFGGFLSGDGQAIFAPARMIAAARARAGTIALDPLAEQGLEALCGDLQAQVGAFSFAGKKLLQAALVEALAKRAALPAVAEAPQRPVFIVAPFRSGTTLLHRLLAEDHRLRAPRTFEVSLARLPGNPDPRIAATGAYLDRIAKRSPEVARLHPVGAELPEECFGLLEPSFLSPSFLFWAPLPGYFRWLDARGPSDWQRAYDCYAAGLAGLGGGGRWLLKSPVHQWGLAALLDRFPEAQVIQIHRDSPAVFASFRKLVAAHHRIYRAVPEDATAGDFVEAVLRTGMERAAEARRMHGDARFIDLSFEALVADPLATVRKLWPRLGLAEDTGALARMARSLAGA